jgi:hypothetical protein
MTQANKTSTYDTLSPHDKARVNAVILEGLEKDSPKGIIKAFQNGLDSASSAIEKGINLEVTRAARPKEAIEARDAKFQEMLGELRNNLAKDPKALPPLDQSVKAERADVREQMSALRAIKETMASTAPNHTLTQLQELVKGAIANDGAATVKDGVTLSQPVTQALTNFMAKHSIAKVAGMEMQSVTENSSPTAVVRAGAKAENALG